MKKQPTEVNNAITENKSWLFVLPTDSLQGSEYIVKTVCSYLVNNDLGRCYVIILSKKSGMGWQDLEDNATIHYLPFDRYFIGLFFLLPFLILKRTIRPDYSFSSQTLINGSLGLAKRMRILRSTKVIARESNSIFKLLKGFKLKVYHLFYKLGYKGTSLVICQTDLMKAQLMESLPKMSTRLNIHTIPNPFDLDNVSKGLKDIPDVLRGKKYIVAAGRLAPVKGFDLLINAFERLGKIDPDLHLVILGEGDERPQLEDLIHTKKLTGRVHLQGYVSNVYPYFREAHMCVLSSLLEGFPNVLLQMMSQNERVVATTSAGDIDKIPGLSLCTPGDQIALEEAMLSSLEENPGSQRRALFDDYLKKRSKENFYHEILRLIG